jgi:uncharacterized protein (TIGR02117 family)
MGPTTKKWLKRILKGIGLLLLPAVLYLLVSLVLSFLSTSPGRVDCPEPQPVYISSNGIHLDIILPLDSLGPDLAGALPVPAGVRYLAFGWGDKGFYLETPTWKELRLSVALKALFWKSGTAMHVTHYRRTYDSWHELALCPEQVDSLRQFIWQSFYKNEAGQVVNIAGAGYTDRDEFYEAVGNYSCLKTCNNWVNIGLKKAGVKTAVWSPFDLGVLHHLNKISKPDN